MGWLLNLVYILVLLVVWPWLVWRSVRQGKYRTGYREKLLGLVPRRDPQDRSPCIWFHAVSVGEVNLLAPLLRRIATERPEWKCVLSTTSSTGWALARKKYPQLLSFYAPLDFSWAVRRAVERIRPTVLVLVELELWPNLIRAARSAGVKVAVINGRLSERSFRGYRWLRPLMARLFRQIDWVAVQNTTYAERFLALGARSESLCVTGSMKFDGAQSDRSNPMTRRLAQWAGFAPEDMIFLAGSTQEPEEALALETFRQLADRWPQLRLVLVPRHPERFDEVARLLSAAGLPWIRRTQLDNCSSENKSTLDKTARPSKARILLVDTVGELGAWWGTAHVAFVGGSLGRRGGQNMIEPAAYGAAVCFGPNTQNFRDIVAMMLARQAAVVVHNGQELTAFVQHALQDPAWAEQLGRRAQTLVAEQQGATQRTFEHLAELVDPRPSCSQAAA